jgi:hypothetical protein
MKKRMTNVNADVAIEMILNGAEIKVTYTRALKVTIVVDNKVDIEFTGEAAAEILADIADNFTDLLEDDEND